jgi:hypothetical protein
MIKANQIQQLLTMIGLLFCLGTAGCAVDFGDRRTPSIDSGADRMLEETQCDDAIDNDGDGYTDCMDPGCFDVYPCAPETNCTDDLDNDDDGHTDCDDSDCAGVAGCIEQDEICDNAVDDDADGATDCDDWECSGDPACGASDALSCKTMNYCFNCCSANDDSCFNSCLSAASSAARNQYDTFVECVNQHCADDCVDQTSELCGICQDDHCSTEYKNCSWDPGGTDTCVMLNMCLGSCPVPIIDHSGDAQSCTTEPGILCYDDCFNKADQDAIDKLMAYQDCYLQNCEVACSSEDPPDCGQCVSDNCESEGMACQND